MASISIPRRHSCCASWGAAVQRINVGSLVPYLILSEVILCSIVSCLEAPGVLLQAVKRLLAAAASTNKELKEFPGGYHELLMGPEKEEAAKTLKDWILKHCPEPEAKL